MSYDDFWFIDTRVQTRNLRRWLIWFVLLFAFVTIGSIIAVKSMYQDIKVYEIRSSNPVITVNEAKATNVNGYIKGEIRNESEETINNKYLCFVLCDENNEVVGREYLEIGSLASGESKTYELQFRRDNIDTFYVIVTDSQE